jgi:hypothetical protein
VNATVVKMGIEPMSVLKDYESPGDCDVIRFNMWISLTPPNNCQHRLHSADPLLHVFRRLIARDQPLGGGMVFKVKPIRIPAHDVAKSGLLHELHDPETFSRFGNPRPLQLAGYRNGIQPRWKFWIASELGT